MHGNTRQTTNGRKTRRFDDVLDELRATFAAHRAVSSHLSGVHFELTGEDVTECVGGGIDLTSEDLGRNYQSSCDPRLNYAQSLEMAFLITKLLKQ
jgi:3-deoxy-7-phosphoheptulonate synthase